MHIGFVVYDGLGTVSGGYRYNRKLVEYLEAQGDIVELINLPWRSYPLQLFDTLRPGLRDKLEGGYDVLLQDELCHPSLWYHNRRLDMSGPIISLVHLLRSPEPGPSMTSIAEPFERRYLDSVDAAICTSAYTERETTALSALPSTVAYPAGRHEGAVIDRIRPSAPSDPLQILFVGNLIPRKGTLTLVKALATLDCAWSATIIGDRTVDKSYASAVESRIEKHDIGDRVSVRGRVDDGSLSAAFESADVLVVPSNYEGFGMVYLEAMEYGTVPIGSSVGGAGEFITHGENGFLVKPGDTAAITQILSGLTSDRQRLRTLGEAALDTARSHPTWAESLEGARQFMQECVDRSD